MPFYVKEATLLLSNSKMMDLISKNPLIILYYSETKTTRLTIVLTLGERGNTMVQNL